MTVNVPAVVDSLLFSLSMSDIKLNLSCGSLFSVDFVIARTLCLCYLESHFFVFSE